ncbi:hypothetical protein NEOKW01_0924 [Nematocida sp. AWRm80]|nr:hypothetical protein NEOKW01_0924 [Nematocida sp. AWRm80]
MLEQTVKVPQAIGFFSLIIGISLAAGIGIVFALKKLYILFNQSLARVDQLSIDITTYEEQLKSYAGLEDNQSMNERYINMRKTKSAFRKELFIFGSIVTCMVCLCLIEIVCIGAIMISLFEITQII